MRLKIDDTSETPHRTSWSATHPVKALYQEHIPATDIKESQIGDIDTAFLREFHGCHLDSSIRPSIVKGGKFSNPKCTIVEDSALGAGAANAAPLGKQEGMPRIGI